MLSQIKTALLVTAVLLLLTGIVYPLAMTGVAQMLFPSKADGSLIIRNGRVIGSELIGQNFTGSRYFHPRPSAAGPEGYDATASGGSNLGPTSRMLVARVDSLTKVLRAENPGTPVPVDLVTASASGLDPEISPAAAEFQAPRIARERGLSGERVGALIASYTRGPQLGVLGEARVNVLLINLALDSISAPPAQSTR